MFGFIEVITLLLGLSGFGLTPNPKPATSDQALYYAIPEADVVVHLDVASVVPGNYKHLLALQNQPANELELPGVALSVPTCSPTSARTTRQRYASPDHRGPTTASSAT